MPEVNHVLITASRADFFSSLLNASVRDTYRSYFVRDDVIELVAEKFAPEIDRFGYSF